MTKEEIVAWGSKICPLFKKPLKDCCSKCASYEAVSQEGVVEELGNDPDVPGKQILSGIYRKVEVVYAICHAGMFRKQLLSQKEVENAPEEPVLEEQFPVENG